LQVNRRLYRCRENRVVAGVASGVAEFLGLDPTLVRILWFLSIFVGGVGILLYIGLALIVPLEPAAPGPVPPHPHNPATGELEGHRHNGSRGSGRVSLYLGITLMVIGAFALVDIALPGWTSWRQLFPILLVLFGGFLIFGSARREPADMEPAPAGASANGGAATAAPTSRESADTQVGASEQEPGER
jgi:phage shock protein PspC (stress-responsive transcriptional regulator)